MNGMQAAHGSDRPQVYQRLTSAIAETQASGEAHVTGDWHESVSAIALGFVGPSGERYVVSCGAAAHLAPREWLAAQAAPALIDCVKRIVDEIGGAPHLRLAD
jgi:DNA-binding IclR family transcriptional regulator